MSALESALDYAAAGFPVLPLYWPTGDSCACGKADCPSKAKHPIWRVVPNGKTNATTDPDVITRWFSRYRDANVGVCPTEGFVVIDLDHRNGGGESLATLIAENIDWPDTLTARTGSGGAHFWFTAPRVSVGRVADGLDVKFHTGYVVAPPSRHVSGGTYEWITDTAIAPAPAWLRRLLAPTRRTRPVQLGKRGAGTGIVHAVAHAKEGQRNDLLYWGARRAVELGDDALLEQVRDAGLSVGLDEREVDTAIRSAQRGGVQ